MGPRHCAEETALHSQGPTGASEPPAETASGLVASAAAVRHGQNDNYFRVSFELSLTCLMRSRAPSDTKVGKRRSTCGMNVEHASIMYL